jgi:hypothetical protein
VGLLLMLAAIDFHAKRISWQRTASFAFVGALAVWFSHPSILILAGIGATLTILELREKRRSHLIPILIAGSVWVASFVLSYGFVLRATEGSDYLEDYWGSSGGFMPFPPTSFSEVQWFGSAFFRTFENPCGLTLPIVGGLTFLVGFISALIKKKAHLLLLLTPIPFALIASGLHKYPSLGRTLLFIVPSLLILIAEGIAWIAQKTPVTGVVLAGFLFFGPLVGATHTAIKQDDTRADIKPTLGHIRKNWRQGDVLYVYYAAKRQFRYYSER